MMRAERDSSQDLAPARRSIGARSCPRPLVLLAMIACNPGRPGGEPGTTTAGTDGVSSSSAADPPTTTGVTDAGTMTDAPSNTDAMTTTSGETTTQPPTPTSWTSEPDDDTTEGFVCNWNAGPDAWDFCPPLAGPNADISGMTPLGPVAFEYAYFGLRSGCVACPHASDGSLAFFDGPDGPAHPEADHLRTFGYSFPSLVLAIAGEEVVVHDHDDAIVLEYTALDIPDVARTNPPLDPEAPPTLSGTLSITGGGWSVSGDFTATLCRDVDNLVPCS